MKTSALRVCGLFAGCAVITACSQVTQLPRSQSAPIVNSALDRGAGSQGYEVLHSFGGNNDGEYPTASLITAGDTFYGVTVNGGSHDWGTVFNIGTDGTENVLHSFHEKIRGRTPYGGLIDVSGTLYGTTAYGGRFDYGTFFSITPGGTEKVLHSFGEQPDGGEPGAELIDVGGTLYGTTEVGGKNGCVGTDDGCGTVFRITTDGKEKVLYSFGKGSDGKFPATGLTDVGGTLYGTTGYGGEYGDGTVFSVTLDGKEKVLHSFRDTPDGAYPYATLLDVKGVLYGTTESGGGKNFCAGTDGGCGTVYRITRGGAEKVLHSFNGTDGRAPVGSLIDVSGTLYGVTVDGGANSCVRYNSGCGTVFSITTDGKEKVLHNFRRGIGGSGPGGGLTFKSGRLFGTTDGGGAYGDGAVFSLTP
jgi:uncharacterized repeat protein (TIGR03803 family)